jgi:hypothetical protein
MSNFHKLLNRAYREIITEQEQPPVQQDPALIQPAPEQVTPTPMPEASVEQGQKILSPEGMVMLIRLLPKALMIDTLEPNEERILADLGDIDEYNAEEAFSKILPIIQKYAPSTEKLPKI